MVMGVPLSPPRQTCKPDQEIPTSQLIDGHLVVTATDFAHDLVTQQLIASEVCFDPFQFIGGNLEHSDELILCVDGEVHLLAEEVGMQEGWVYNLWNLRVSTECGLQILFQVAVLVFLKRELLF